MPNVWKDHLRHVAWVKRGPWAGKVAVAQFISFLVFTDLITKMSHECEWKGISLPPLAVISNSICASTELDFHKVE